MVLFHSISWGAFAVTALILTLIYYGWVAWKYFRRPAKPQEPLPHSLVIPSKPDEGTAQIESEEFIPAENA